MTTAGSRLHFGLALAGAVLFVPAPAAAQTEQPEPATMRFVVAAEGNEARYRVREQLARLDFPNDAVGTTGAIDGGITIDAAGNIVREQSRFIIDMSSLATDSGRRDNYVRRNTLQTADHPTAEFVPTAFRNLSFPLPASGPVEFQILGDLTLRGVTRPVTWTVTAAMEDGAVRGEATTSLTFEQFEMQKPRVASVLSVADDIRLEYSFVLVPAR